MAKRRIFTVGFTLPGDDFEYIRFESDQTLLDADIILFEPTLGHCAIAETYNGRPLLAESSSLTVKEKLSHWRSEIAEAVNAGKLVVVYLAKPIQCYRYTGEKRFLGTGRSQVPTNLVAEVSSYEAVPYLKDVVPKTGTGMQLEREGAFLAPYWREFSSYSRYEVEITGEFKRVLLRSRAGDRILGAAICGVAGTLLLLPPLRYDRKRFVRFGRAHKNKYWTRDALSFGQQLAAALAALSDSLRESVHATPPPSWALGDRFRLFLERELEGSIASLSSEIEGLQSRKAGLGNNLWKAGSLRRLLYEQGRPLEAAVLEALRLFGFDAEPFANAESEFDAVFVSAAGRCLGEAEGRDNRAVNVDKISQLERNLQEDFAREGVTDFAKGVLFGNPFRLAPPADRPPFFTEKCLSAARRARIALVRTPDLFEPAKYMKEHPADLDYAAQCRKAIFRAEGQVVVFPAAPVSKASTPTAGATDVPV
jgi:hypothetical protein